MPPKASGVTNSVARTSPNRSTTVSQMIEEISQCRAAWSGKGERPRPRCVSGAGASAVSVPPPAGLSTRLPSPPIARDDRRRRRPVRPG